MAKKSKKKEKIVLTRNFYYLIISLLTALLIYGLYMETTIFDNLELGAIDEMFVMRNDKPIPQGNVIKKNPFLNENIVIIGIDEKAISTFGRWPWNRKIHARLINYLRRAKPRAVFFDIFFSEYSDNKAADRALFNAVRFNKKENIFFDYPMEKKREGIDIKSIKNRLLLLDRTVFPPVPGSDALFTYNYIAPPVIQLLKYARGSGHAVIESDSDDKYRRVPLVVKFNNKLYPQIVFTLALDYFKVKKDNVIINIGKNIILKNAQIPIKDEFGDITGYKTEDIVIPIDNKGQMLINYVGWPGEFNAQSQYFSYADIFNMPPEFFNDKILFIGAYAQGMAQDIWPSPLGVMYGIEHNANAFNTLIQRNFLTYVPDWVNLVIIILIGLLIGLITPRVKIGWSILVIILLMLGLAYAVFFYVFPILNKIMLFATPLFAIIFTYITSLLYKILTEEKEKKFIKERFSNYVSKTVVDELLKNPKALQLGGEDRIITVFFSDVRSFTTISEQLGEPQKLVALLNEYLSAMTEIIFQYEGTLDKYVGDEIMAFWGAPVEQPDHAYRACKAALAQIKYLTEVLHPKWEKEGKPKLRIGIGINTGKMTVGNMGSKSRMDYTLMGDEVNLGSRLEGTNKVYKTTIIISEATYEIVKDKVIARELDIIRVKGKSKPVRIFELMGLKDEEIEIKPLNL